MPYAEEDQLRTSLNAYYSSKCNAQATYLLTVGVVAIGVIGLQVNRMLLPLILAGLVAITFRMLVRTVYWGKLSHLVLAVPLLLDKRPMIYALHEEVVNTLEQRWWWRTTFVRCGRVSLSINLRIWSLTGAVGILTFAALTYLPILARLPVPLTYAF